jgi:hypothetical protein
MKIINKKTLRYFDYFNNKNIEGLETEMYADDVTLKDWVCDVAGKQSVLDMNKKLFQNEFTIKVNKVITDETNSVVLFELHIGNEILSICDVINWNDEGKIKSVIAFKG